MLKYIFWGIILYFLVRFVFNFLIPVIRTGRQMSRQMREFQDRMNTPPQGTPNNFTKAETHENKAKAGDYIDFEEIKER